MKEDPGAAAVALLGLWLLLTGNQLDDRQQREFIGRDEVDVLTQYPLRTLVSGGRSVIGSSGGLKLTDWVRAVQNPPSPAVVATPPERSRSRATRQSPRSEPRMRPPAERSTRALRSRDGLTPQSPMDTDLARRLAKKFGPVQQYDDTF